MATILRLAIVENASFTPCTKVGLKEAFPITNVFIANAANVLQPMSMERRFTVAQHAVLR